MKQKSCRKYFAVLEKETGYLVAILPFTRKKSTEITSDLKEILIELCEKHQCYKGKALTIQPFRRPLISNEIKFTMDKFPFEYLTKDDACNRDH